MTRHTYDWADIKVTFDGQLIHGIRTIEWEQTYPPTLSGFRRALQRVVDDCADRGWEARKPIAIDAIEPCRAFIERRFAELCPGAHAHVTVEGIAEFVIRPQFVELIGIEVRL